MDILKVLESTTTDRARVRAHHSIVRAIYGGYPDVHRHGSIAWTSVYDWISETLKHGMTTGDNPGSIRSDLLVFAIAPYNQLPIEAGGQQLNDKTIAEYFSSMMNSANNWMINKTKFVINSCSSSSVYDVL